MEGKGTRRRSLAYIRLAAFLAGQPSSVDRLELSLGEIEEVIGEPLPPNARFPSWWRNDDRRMHSRAWLLAGWTVIESSGRERIVFGRRRESDAPAT